MGVWDSLLMGMLQLSVPRELENAVRLEAERTGKSISEVGREWLSTGRKLVVENGRILRIMPLVGIVYFLNIVVVVDLGIRLVS